MGNESGRRNVFATLWAGIKRVFTLGLSDVKLPAEVPSNTKELRRLINYYEKKGFDCRKPVLLCKQADEDPGKAATCIEEAVRVLMRKALIKKLCVHIFFNIILILVTGTVSWVLADWVRNEEWRYYRIVYLIGLLVTIFFVRNVLVFLRRVIKIRASDVPWSSEVPRNTEELCRIIVEFEAAGINVKEAWKLYKVAEGIEKKGSGEKVPQANLEYYLQRAFADLLKKRKLKGISTLAIWLSFLFFVAVILFFGALIFRDVSYDRIVLGVPLFIVFWGLVGSASYILLMENRKIRNMLLDWFGFVRYSYRIALGGVLAAITFYIIQLGAISLPGAVGEEVSGALEMAEALERNREIYKLKAVLEPKIARYPVIVEDFEYAGRSGIDEKVETLILYQKDWAGLVSGMEKIDGRSIKDPVLSPTELNKRWDEYKRERSMRDERLRYFYFVLQGAIDLKMKPDDPKYKDLKEKLQREGDDIVARFRVLLKNASVWETVSIPYKIAEGEISARVDIGGEDVGIYLDKYDALTARVEYFRGAFNTVNTVFLEKAREDKLKAEEEIRNIELETLELKACLDSVELLEKQNELKRQLNRLKLKKEIIEGDISGLGPKPEVSGEAAEDWESRSQSLNSRKEALAILINEKETEKSQVEAKLKEAMRRELGKPVWESPLFIVIAFLSGYSVEFVIRLLKKAEELILPEKSEDKEDKEDNKSKETREDETT